MSSVSSHQHVPTAYGLTVSQIARYLDSTGGACPDTAISNISTDSRAIKPSELFVALRGPNHDAHRYLAEVAEKGAAAAVVLEGAAIEGVPGSLPLIRVPDTQQALEKLANLCRHRSSARFLAITGSNGKTTTKTFAASLLSRFGPVSSSQKSHNNNIGVPLTIFAAGHDDQWVVLEMGTNHFGELAHLAGIAEPEVASITNVGETHLEFLGSQEGVARAKAELIAALPRTGTAVLNADDPFTPFLRSQTPAERIVTFGLQNGADIFASDVEETPTGCSFRLNGEHKSTLNAPGRHNLMNALAAVALGHACGLPLGEMAATIRDFELPELRMQAQEIGPVTVVLDAYNANPTSMRHALDVFDRWPAKARRILVLGEMKELGEASARCHETLGSDVASRKFDILFTVGPGAACLHRAVHQNGIAGSRLFHCETTGEAARELASCVRQGDTLFLKGSRALALEQITQSLRERYEKETALE